MKTASEGFVAALNQPIRPTTQFRAEIGVSSAEVEANAAFSTQRGVASFSSGLFEKAQECEYITFEPDFFQVGSDQRIVPESGGYLSVLKNGVVSAATSDDAGDMVTMIFSVTFPEAEDFSMLTFQFAHCYPFSMDVAGYLEGANQGSIRLLPSGTEVHVALDFGRIDSLSIRMQGTSVPYRRIRLNSMWLGWHTTFETCDIISVDHTMQIDPVSASLPSHHLRMQVTNLDKRFNPDNPSGVWAHLTSGQPVKIQYGTEVNGETEWLDVDTLYLLDAPTVDENSATFEAYDRLYFLNETYYKGVINMEGATLHSLAEAVLKDAGVSEYRLDESLKAVTTVEPVPVLPHRECLQLIANAGRCVLRTDATGAVVMEAQSHETFVATDYRLDFANALNKPLVKQTETLKSVEVMAYSLSLPTGYGEAGVANNVDVYVDPSVYVTYKKCLPWKPMFVDAPTGFDTVNGIVGHELYAQAGWVHTSGGDYFLNIAVSGKVASESKTPIVTRVNPTGEICDVDNPLITSWAHAQRVGQWIAAYLSKRNTYEVNFRQDFRLEPNDVITFQTQFEENIPVRITKLQFKLPGQSGAISVRRLT